MKQRIITGTALGAVFIGLLQLGGYGFSAMIIALALIGFYEFLRINDIRPSSAVGVVGFIAVTAVVVPWNKWIDEALPGLMPTVWLTMLVLLFATVWSKNKVTLVTASIVFLGVLYIGIGFHYMIETRLEFGRYWSYLLFLCVWLTDIGAYFTGYAFGKHKLWPSISPNKTIEGAVGGMFFSILTAVMFSIFVPDLLSLVHAIVLGLLVSIVGQAGDLIQSAYKRLYGVKDSGAIFPGHGGVLDRTDSWLTVFPFVYLLGLMA